MDDVTGEEGGGREEWGESEVVIAIGREPCERGERGEDEREGEEKGREEVVS